MKKQSVWIVVALIVIGAVGMWYLDSKDTASEEHAGVAGTVLVPPTLPE